MNKFSSAPDPMDERNMVMESIAMEEFGRPLKDLNENQIRQIEEMIMEMDIPYDAKKDRGVPRVMAQEGGIMPRLNQLGGGVSSAEQMLQEINQRLESAESSLGSGGTLASAGPNVGNEIAVPSMSGTPTFTPLPSDKNFFMGNMFRGGDLVERLTPLNQLNVTPPQTPVAMQQPMSGIPALGYAEGGIIGGLADGQLDDMGRQMYGLGKLVKKITGGIKKIAKSPIGRAALFAAPFAFNPGAKATLGSFFGKGSFNPFKAVTLSGGSRGLLPQTALSGLGKLLTNIPGISTTSLLSGASGVGAGILGTSVLAGLLTPAQKKQAQLIADDTGIDIQEIEANPEKYLATRFMAEGGDVEPVAKKTMPLLDMDGREMDLRQDGGFVPIGRMERADDVPARLSKNEFVFTADAVRNAGEGNIDKGAEVMYNMMKNLEAGGEVSEESQGLEGARKMFQTSQRLGEVI